MWIPELCRLHSRLHFERVHRGEIPDASEMCGLLTIEVHNRDRYRGCDGDDESGWGTRDFEKKNGVGPTFMWVNHYDVWETS